MTYNHFPDILLDATDCDQPAGWMNCAALLMNESLESANDEFIYTNENCAKLHQIVRAIARNLVWHDRAVWDADDVAQDAWVELLSQEQNIKNPAAWFKRAVSLCVRAKLRSEYRWKEILQDLPSCESGPEDQFTRRSSELEKRATVVSQAVQLSPDEAIYILLKDVSGLPMSDIICFMNNTFGNESGERNHYHKHKKAREKLVTRLRPI